MKKILKHIWDRWKKIAHAIGRFQTRVIITLFYFIVISPLGAVMNLFGWDPLQKRKSKLQADSNWKTVENGEPDLESLRRQS